MGFKRSLGHGGGYYIAMNNMAMCLKSVKRQWGGGGPGVLGLR